MEIKMFEDEAKGIRILRITIGINIVCIALLVFYIFQLISLELLYDDGTVSIYSWWPLLWTIVFVLLITVTTVQLTFDMDMMLFKRSLEESGGGGRLQKRVELWTKISSGFLVLCTLCFSLSIFLNARENPWLIFTLGFGGLTLRLILLYMAYQYLAHLKYKILSSRPDGISCNCYDDPCFV